MNLTTFLEYNFGPIVGLIFQVMILLMGRSFTRTEKRVFLVTVLLEIIEIGSYNAEFYFSELSTPSMWRVFFSVVGYIVRPALVYPFIYLMRCETKFKDNKWFFLDLLPLLFVIVVQMLAFGTDWVFSYNENNNFNRGPLGYVSMIVTILYLVEASVNIALAKIFDRKVGVSLIILVLVYVVLAMVIESYFEIRSLGISAAVFSIVYFMFALQTNHLDAATQELKILSEVDALSQLSNRYFGEKVIDDLVSERKAGMFAIIDIDNFKHINDTYGHAAGDEAIAKISATLKECLREDDVVMRLGGDEFAIYSMRSFKENKSEETIRSLFGKIDGIRLSPDPDFRVQASIGVAIYDGSEESSFDALYHLADVNLYEAKKHPGNYVCY